MMKYEIHHNISFIVTCGNNYHYAVGDNAAECKQMIKHIYHFCCVDCVQFKEISFAYEVLTDPEKKEIYDRHGIKGLKDGGASPSGKLFQYCFAANAYSGIYSSCSNKRGN